jgi:proline dehydrogenase
MQMKSKTEEYEFTPAEVSRLIAKELNVSPDRVKVRFVVEHKYDEGDWRGESAGTYEMTKVNAIVDNMPSPPPQKSHGVER